MTASNVAMIDDFNPRSHEGSDVSGTGVEAGSDGISIHAPTRGATSSDKPTNISSYISIHAPTRGATTNTVQGVTPTGISIHAPTRGATKILRHTPKGKQFQSTLPRGERHVVGIPFKGIWDFNPRSHEGSDRLKSVLQT